MFLFKKPKPEMSFLDKYKQLPSAMIYSDNIEYRNSIRKVFQFDLNEKYSYDGKVNNYDELDEISRDELLFDNKSMVNGMNELFYATKKNSIFQDLYKSAAARMFSESMEIGQAVLCSYDTFSWYHTCVWFYLNSGITEVISCAEYNNLQKYFEN